MRVSTTGSSAQVVATLDPGEGALRQHRGGEHAQRRRGSAAALSLCRSPGKLGAHTRVFAQRSHAPEPSSRGETL